MNKGFKTLINIIKSFFIMILILFIFIIIIGNIIKGENLIPLLLSSAIIFTILFCTYKLLDAINSKE